MIVFLENPVPIVVIGILLEAVLAVALVRTGRGVILWGMLGVLTMVLASVVLERVVVTELEQVEETVYAVAQAVQDNDAPGVLKYVDPSNTDTTSLINWAMRQVQFTEAKITGLEIEFNDLTNPPQAVARVIGHVSYKSNGGMMNPYGRYLVNLTVVLTKNSGRWMILRHTMKNDPRG